MQNVLTEAKSCTKANFPTRMLLALVQPRTRELGLTWNLFGELEHGAGIHLELFHDGFPHLQGRHGGQNGGFFIGVLKYTTQQLLR